MLNLKVARYAGGVLVFLALSFLAVTYLKLPSKAFDSFHRRSGATDDVDSSGTRWFNVLLAGFNSYRNYPHHRNYPYQEAIKQEDVDMLYFWNSYLLARNSSKVEAEKLYIKAMTYRMHVDSSIELIEGLLFGPKRIRMLKVVRPKAQQLVDHDCRDSMVDIFESFCGPLDGPYALKQIHALDNMCDAGIRRDEMAQAAAKACADIPASTWRSIVDELDS